MAAGEVGMNGQLPMAAIDEYRKINPIWAAELTHCIEGGADGAPFIDHVINEDDDAIGEVAGHGAFGGGAHADGAEVVPVKGDVQLTDENVVLFEGLDLSGEGCGEGNAPRMDANEDNAGEVADFFDDFGGEAGEGAANFVGGEDFNNGGSHRRSQVKTAGSISLAYHSPILRQTWQRSPSSSFKRRSDTASLLVLGHD